MPDYDPASLASLTRINLDDVLSAFGWDPVRFGRGLLGLLFRPSARSFAHLVLDYDRYVAEFGLQEGARRFLKQMQWGLEVECPERIPHTGPLMVLSNHPGMADTVALFAAIPRPELRIVAAERPFLRALAATDRRLIYVPEAAEGRLDVLKAIATQLRSGGAILTFPAGQIEPDPALLPGALESLDTWASSIGALARIVPATQIVIAMVGGVLAPQAQRHALTHLRRHEKDRQRLGATFQLLAKIWFPDRWNVQIRVRFSPPILAADLIPLKDPAAITWALLERVKPFVSEFIASYAPR